MIKIIKLIPQKDFKLWLKFEDGLEGTVDLSNLKDKGVFKIWAKPGVFERDSTHSASGAVA